MCGHRRMTVPRNCSCFIRDVRSSRIRQSHQTAYYLTKRPIPFRLRRIKSFNLTPGEARILVLEPWPYFSTNRSLSPLLIPWAVTPTVLFSSRKNIYMHFCYDRNSAFLNQVKNAWISRTSLKTKTLHTSDQIPMSWAQNVLQIVQTMIHSYYLTRQVSASLGQTHTVQTTIHSYYLTRQVPTSLG